MQWLYLALAVVGAVLPYAPFLPWLAENGLDLSLFFGELFSTRISAAFGLDVMVSAVVTLAFILQEGARRRIRQLWVPIVATFVFGVACGLSLFLYLREAQADGRT